MIIKRQFGGETLPRYYEATGDFEAVKDAIKLTGARWNGSEKVWEISKPVVAVVEAAGGKVNRLRPLRVDRTEQRTVRMVRDGFAVEQPVEYLSATGWRVVGSLTATVPTLDRGHEMRMALLAAVAEDADNFEAAFDLAIEKWSDAAEVAAKVKEMLHK